MCQRPNYHFEGLFTCYVNQPSSCMDLVNSDTKPGELESAEACLDVNSDVNGSKALFYAQRHIYIR